MGQRLNIEIIKNGKVVGNCYYHWSAYTLSSLIETNTVIENYDELLKQNLPDKVLTTKMFENCKSLDFFSGNFNHAGLSEDSYEYMCNKYPNYEFRKAIDRNAGLIGITEKDIDDTRGWEEGRVTIDLDKEIIDAGLMIDYREIDEYEQDCIDNEEEFNLDNIPKFPVDNLDEIPFNDLKKVIDKIIEYDKKGIYVFKNKDNSEIITLIA